VWPWPGRCTHELALTDHALTLTATVEAVDGASFPAAVGWHPWFAKPASVELAATSMLERGDDHLPTGQRVAAVAPGERPLDDCFEDVAWPVTIGWADGCSLRVDADGCRYAVVYDEQAATTCVEPQTASPDALNSGGAATVEPGRPLRATMRFLWAAE
jgi:aldose 1-epimerase